MQSEVAALTEKAEQCDGSEQQDCAFHLPDEIARREARKARIEEAIAVIESPPCGKVSGSRKRNTKRKCVPVRRLGRRARSRAAPEPKEPEATPAAKRSIQLPRTRRAGS